MTFLRSVLAAVLLGLAGAVCALVVAAPAAVALPAPAADADNGTPHQGSAVHDGSGAATSEHRDTLGLVAGGSGLLILVSIAGGAWRYRRDPRTAARGH